MAVEEEEEVGGASAKKGSPPSKEEADVVPVELPAPAGWKKKVRFWRISPTSHLTSFIQASPCPNFLSFAFDCDGERRFWCTLWEREK
ncbi:hypothetical protein GW17_00030062 [Ensete ventricosum]|nr:hypothetical protein GW17_00030062 [Ensete ventricosum]